MARKVCMMTMWVKYMNRTSSRAVRKEWVESQSRHSTLIHIKNDTCDFRINRCAAMPQLARNEGAPQVRVVTTRRRRMV